MKVENFLKSAKRSYLDETLTRPDWTKDISRNEKLLWLDKNENLDPILNSKLNELLKEVKPFAINTYPETAKIYKKLAIMTGLKPENFLLTNGSDGSIRVAFDVFVNPGDKVIHTSPTFAMYSVYSKMYGANAISYEYEASPNGPVFNIEGFFQLIKSQKPKLVCLPNPDSPTGTVVEPKKLQELVELTNELGSVLLIDEAYFGFYNHSLLNLVNQFPNLLVCRTFSKAWGAAGIRVGFLGGHPEVMRVIHKNRAMYEVSTFSSEFINLLIDHEKDVSESVEKLNQGKKYFVAELQNMGFITTKTYGNFVHVNFGEKREKIHQVLKDTVLYKAEFPGVKCLDNFSRFSLGTAEQFEQVINKIRSIL